MINGAKSFLFGLLALLLALCTMSCADEVLDKSEAADGPVFSETVVLGDKEVVLGEKIANPFSMSGAKSKALADGTEVEAKLLFQSEGSG